MEAHAGEYHEKEIKAGVHMNKSAIWCNIKRELYSVWMQETTQRIIEQFSLLLPDLLIKTCSYVPDVILSIIKPNWLQGWRAKGQNLFANISTSRASLFQGQYLIQEK